MNKNTNNLGYIYLRNHKSYEIYNAYKLGKASNIVERESTYKTGEIEKGKFIFVIEVKNNFEEIIEKLLKNHFNKKDLRVYKDGGTEFYKREIINLICPFLDNERLKYRVLTNDEIDNLTREKENKYKYKYKIDLKNFIKYVKNNVIPKDHQINVLNTIDNFYNTNDIGKLLWSCGLGKTLLSLLIVKKLNYRKILIGVPSIFLQKQFINEILKIFPNNDNILCIGGDTLKSTNNKSTILSFLDKKKKEIIFIITTYTSCHLLINDININDINDINDIEFDFKIGDETHHLTGIENNETKNYKLFHKIQSEKTLYMTATEKTLDTQSNKIIYSMDDEDIFGKLIDKKSVQWAIEKKKITDYYLLIISNTENEINDIINELNINILNKELFISAFMALKSIEKYNDLTHILICCNTTDNTEIIKSYIQKILDKNIINIDKSSFYNEDLHSNKKININLELKNNEIEKFKNSKYGIISSVYIFGEGFDLPRLNAVIFAENMLSDIRIVQTSLRPNRLDKENPKKKSYIIIPYMESINKEQDNMSFNRVRIIIDKLRNEDSIIEQKMHFLNLFKNKPTETNNTNNNNKNYNYDFIDDKKELNKIKLRLKYSKALNSTNTEEQDEYNYIKSINKELNIKSKEEYSSIEIKEIHKNYIDNADEYFKLKGVWNDWYDFIGFDTSIFIQSKEEWIKFCKNKNQNINTVNDYLKLCNIYNNLPRNPSDFYKNSSNILSELKMYDKRR